MGASCRDERTNLCREQGQRRLMRVHHVAALEITHGPGLPSIPLSAMGILEQTFYR